MRNPWLDLPRVPPYVLPADRAVVDKFNQNARPQHRIDLAALPEPYLGSPDAPIVLLNKNPGFDPRDADTHQIPHFRNAYFKCLIHEDQDFPFYLLDSRNEGGGFRYWTQRLGPLLKEFSADLLARNLFCVEFFPYHSKQYAHERLTVAGGAYSKFLVENALSRRALVVVMRGRRAWEARVPGLVGYERLHCLNSPQNVTLSANNCPQGYPNVLRELRARSRDDPYRRAKTTGDGG